MSSRTPWHAVPPLADRGAVTDDRLPESPADEEVARGNEAYFAGAALGGLRWGRRLWPSFKRQAASFFLRRAFCLLRLMGFLARSSWGRGL